MSGQLRTAALAAGISFVITAVVDLLLLAIAVAVSGPVVVEIPGRSQPVGVVEILVVTLLTSIVAAIGSAVLARWSWGLTVVIVVGTIITLVSLVAVFNATTPAGVVALGLMHLVTGATLVIVNVVLHRRRRVGAAQPA